MISICVRVCMCALKARCLGLDLLETKVLGNCAAVNSMVSCTPHVVYRHSTEVFKWPQMEVYY